MADILDHLQSSVWLFSNDLRRGAVNEIIRLREELRQEKLRLEYAEKMRDKIIALQENQIEYLKSQLPNKQD